MPINYWLASAPETSRVSTLLTAADAPPPPTTSELDLGGEDGATDAVESTPISRPGSATRGASGPPCWTRPPAPPNVGVEGLPTTDPGTCPTPAIINPPENVFFYSSD